MSKNTKALIGVLAAVAVIGCCSLVAVAAVVGYHNRAVLANVAAAFRRAPKAEAAETDLQPAKAEPAITAQAPITTELRISWIEGALGKVTDLLPAPVETEGGVPFSGHELYVSMEKDAVELITTGPVSFTVGSEEYAFVGGGEGEDRGSVLVFYHSCETPQRFGMTGMMPAGAWHGKFNLEDWDGTLDEGAGLIAAYGTSAMLDPENRNCSENGCDVVDIAIIRRDCLPGVEDKLILKDVIEK